jgi:membrane-bound ClpP family serine protease
MYRGGSSIGGIIYLIIGVILAANHGYFGVITSVSTLLNALLAVLLWPLMLFGVSFNLNFGI